MLKSLAVMYNWEIQFLYRSLFFHLTSHLLKSSNKWQNVLIPQIKRWTFFSCCCCCCCCCFLVSIVMCALFPMVVSLWEHNATKPQSATFNFGYFAPFNLHGLDIFFICNLTLTKWDVKWKYKLYIGFKLPRLFSNYNSYNWWVSSFNLVYFCFTK